jgi:hypothetical protein
MSQATKRQRWSSGSVVRIDLEEAGVGYGQMLVEPEYAFFAETNPAATAAEVVASSVLFRLWVSRRAHASGRWAKIGRSSVATFLTTPVLRFNQDPIEPARITLGHDGISGRPCSLAECSDFERAAIWEPEHVEERLVSHRLGRQSEWVRLLLPRGP